jgi:UDP-N-acetylglucosamine--N-acetylmuramyl-(pentapeptide) pyrophosphoryl-undecaprenol N-acetylglucosamine transferase
VAEALRERGVAVTFAGSPDRVEARLVPERGYAFDGFAVAGFPRRPGPSQLRALALAAAAPVACLRILERRKPDVVLGGGGYVAGPMVLAARLRGIPAVLTEADAHLGLANRLAAPFAARVFLAYPSPGRQPPKYQVVGRPVPSSSVPTDRDAARRRFGLPLDERVVLVVGGSLGSWTLNDTAVKAWGASGPSVLHLSGERDFEAIYPWVACGYYQLYPFVDDFGAALAAADLVVSRAGGTVWEIAAAGKPAVLVPYPSATGDHQHKNAEYFASRGGAIIVEDEDVPAELPSLVEDLIRDTERLRVMAAAMRAAAKPDAAERIADELVELAAARR